MPRLSRHDSEQGQRGLHRHGLNGVAPLAVGFAVGIAATLAPSTARAHFTLNYPQSWTLDNSPAGDPQKAYPCGVLATDTYTPSNMITSFSPGQTITVKWTEEIAHDGWFRIALSYADGAEFQSTTDFPEPVYETANGLLGTMSVDAGIESPAIPPVLADGLWPHSAASVSTPKQYAQVITLPTRPCTKCVLQVLQIMLNHPVNSPNNVPGAGFTYHHCAFIAIEQGADGGAQRLPDAGEGDATVHGGGSGTGASSGSNGSSGSPGPNGTGSSEDAGSSGAVGSSDSDGSSGATSSDGPGASGHGAGCSISTARGAGSAGLASVAGLAIAASILRARRRKRQR
jgi:hypothetical protein